MEKLIKQTTGSLAGQFVLGMTLNVLGEPQDISSHLVKGFYFVVLALHILVALWLVVSIIRILRLTPDHDKKFANLAAGALGVAFVAGWLTTIAKPRELWSFVMAIGFLATFRFLSRLAAHSPSPNTRT